MSLPQTQLKGNVTLGSDTGATVSIGQTDVNTGTTPNIANITQNNDAVSGRKGCSLAVGQNNGGSTYRLLLAGKGDTYHYIYSTGQAGDNTYFGEYSQWNFYSTNLNTTKATISATTGVYTAVSDRNQKKDFEPSLLGLQEILQLKPTLYRYKNGTVDREEQDLNEPKSVGFIAQEVQPILPQAYSESGDFIGLDYNSFIPVLVKAIQEIKQEYDQKLSTLETRILALEGK
jgi:hypothetical protein